MSGYILCQTKRASLPYFIENISTNVYSIEELCYYLYHNLYLVDQTIMNEGLCSWIQEELELTGLAAKLRSKIGKFVSVEDILYPVFKEINYLTYEEMKKLNNRLTVMSSERAAVRQKRKGDSLIENGMYVNAIQVYQKILERGDLDEQRRGFEASVRYNLGCAYSYLFQMEKAAECFLASYRKEHSLKSLQAYLLARKSIQKDTDYDKVMEELGTEENMRNEVKENIKQSLNAFAAIPERKTEEKNLNTVLETITKEYHRSTGCCSLHAQ